MNCIQYGSYENANYHGKTGTEGKGNGVGFLNQRKLPEQRKAPYPKPSPYKRKFVGSSSQPAEYCYGNLAKTQLEVSLDNKHEYATEGAIRSDKRISTQGNWQRQIKDDKTQGPNVDNKVPNIKGESINMPELPNTNQNKKSNSEMPKRTNPIHEMKKQILKELMEINNIPASYFLLGKDSAYHKLDIGIDNVAELVEISTNQDGDIVIKPNEASIIAHYSLGKRNVPEQQKPTICENAVRISKLETPQKITQSPQRKLKTAGNLVLQKRCVSIKQPHLKQLNVEKHENKPCPTTNTETKKKVNSPLHKSNHIVKELPPPKPTIKIWHEADTHLQNHPINVLFKVINETLAICGKLKNEYTNESQREL